MKKLFYVVLLTLFAAPAAFAKDHYIADQLFTYMHSGPNNTYRIIGSINAGQKIKLLSANKETGFSQVSDSRGRTGWVESKFVSSKESISTRLPRIEKELASTKQKLEDEKKHANTDKADLVTSVASLKKQIDELEQHGSSISKQLDAAQVENRQLRAKLDTQKDDLLLKYFTYGGGVAGLGLLLGLILPHLIPRRRTSPNGWK